MTKAWPFLVGKVYEPGTTPGYHQITHPDISGIMKDPRARSLLEGTVPDDYERRKQIDAEYTKEERNGDKRGEWLTRIYRHTNAQVVLFKSQGKDYTIVRLSEHFNPSFFGKDYAEGKLSTNIATMTNGYTGTPHGKSKWTEGPYQPPALEDYDKLLLWPEMDRDNRQGLTCAGVLLEGHHWPRGVKKDKENQTRSIQDLEIGQYCAGNDAVFCRVELTPEEIQAVKNVGGTNYQNHWLESQGTPTETKYKLAQPAGEIDLSDLLPSLKKEKSEPAEPKPKATTKPKGEMPGQSQTEQEKPNRKTSKTETSEPSPSLTSEPSKPESKSNAAGIGMLIGGSLLAGGAALYKNDKPKSFVEHEENRANPKKSGPSFAKIAAISLGVVTAAVGVWKLTQKGQGR